MSDIENLAILNKYNKWWNREKLVEQEFKRRDFYQLRQKLEEQRITVLLGPRRVGKTELIKQLINNLLSTGVDPKRILYLSVDAEELRLAKASLNDIMDAYAKFIVKEPLDNFSNKHYIFLDEIQSQERWHVIIKNWYDLKYNLKIFVSGSSSVALSKGAMESLLGRFEKYELYPLKFSETVQYRYPKLFEDNKWKEVRATLLNAISSKTVLTLFKQFEDLYGTLSPAQKNIEILLNRYLVVGGYPEYLEEQDFSRINTLLREKIESSFYRDIVLQHRVRSPYALRDLFADLALHSSQKFNINSAANDFGIERPTLKAYIGYLEDMYLISNTVFFSKSRRVRGRRLKKMYIQDPGIRNAAINRLDELLLKEGQEVGMVVESITADHLRRLRFSLERAASSEIFYWEGKKGEVDFVLEIKRNAIPIEVKYREDIETGDTKSTKEFIDEKGSPFGIILTKKQFAITENILYIPLWLFLMII